MSGAVYRQADPTETRTLENTRPHWKGSPLAWACVGQLPNGQWIFGGGICLPTGFGISWPLGRWSDSNWPTFDHPDEAWQAAMLRIIKRVDDATTRDGPSKESRAVRAWALMMGRPADQADLFETAIREPRSLRRTSGWSPAGDRTH